MVLQSTTGTGHQIKADLKLITATKSTLESIRMEVSKNEKFAALALILDAAIEEAADVAYSIEEALNLND